MDLIVVIIMVALLIGKIMSFSEAKSKSKNFVVYRLEILTFAECEELHLKEKFSINMWGNELCNSSSFSKKIS